MAKEAVQLVGDKKLQLINPFPIKHDQFPKFMNSCSLFILTSYNEGSPNVIKEAMACNIPIVATNVGDINEVIGKTKGCFISSFETSEFSDKIKKALIFGSRTDGRKDIKHLESGLVAQKIIKIYNTILEK